MEKLLSKPRSSWIQSSFLSYPDCFPFSTVCVRVQAYTYLYQVLDQVSKEHNYEQDVSLLFWVECEPP